MTHFDRRAVLGLAGGLSAGWFSRAALAADASGAAERMKTKLVTGRFFVERMLPETATHLARIQAGAASTMELAAEAF